MKVGELGFEMQYVGNINMRDIDCTPAEFKELLDAVREIQKMEVEKAKINAESAEAINLPRKPEKEATAPNDEA